MTWICIPRNSSVIKVKIKSAFYINDVIRMKERKLPPKVKIIEALSAVADERIIIEDLLSKEWKCKSASSPWKTYKILYNEKENAILSNDSWTTNQWFLWYPAIAFLLKIWKLKYDERILEMMKDIDRADIKEKVHKDYESSYRLILWNLHMQWFNVDYFISQVENIYNQISELHLKIM